MADIPDTYADQSNWKALPVPAEDTNLICQVQPISVTFKADPSTTIGIILNPGDVIRVNAGDTGHIRPHEALGGVAVFERFGMSF
ncbi:MAG: hypothetical protein EP336_09555 [Rhodobacteraceae bacterium]|nr:MAG: hypothetical protein EP336_09555 [Paracoccaceae bacterium]